MSGPPLKTLVSGSPLKTLMLVAAGAALLASITLVPKYATKTTTEAVGGEVAPGDEQLLAADLPPGVSPDSPEARAQLAAKRGKKITTTGGAQAAGIACAKGKNGGNPGNEVGVTGDQIFLAANHVASGTGASFLGSSHVGIEAVVNKTNRTGGVCGRRLEIDLKDDAWDGPRGKTNIEDFIKQGKFALPVVPSSEGLTLAIEAGIIKKAGIPVVGSDGMLIQQYQDPWVWPVATATNSQMRIMAKYAYEVKGARTFGIVYDKFYRFGREGAAAFRDYVRTLPGATLKADVGVEPNAPSYKTDADTFNGGCNPCDMVALLLEPTTAKTWVNAKPQKGTKLTSGAQPLFNREFAGGCGDWCHNMVVWTGYNPPVGRFAGLQGVKDYQKEVRSVDSTIDTSNAFLEGSYLGMSVFVEALKRVGPVLTRDRLKAELERGDYSGAAPDLVSRLSWTSQRHYANITAQAFTIVYAQGGFADFGEAGTGFRADPEFGG